MEKFGNLLFKLKDLFQFLYIFTEISLLFDKLLEKNEFTLKIYAKIVNKYIIIVSYSK